MTVNTTSQSWFARQGSPEVFITYRTHEHRTLFRARNRLLCRGASERRLHGTIVLVVLGGEPAVPCTRNPL